MNIYEKLNLIQVSLKSPKSQYNSFGKYAYRSCGDILESVKAQLAELKVVIVLSDELVQIGDRYYIKATATLHDLDGASISNTAYAREEETKKGMDGSQVTGASSSYARKYALNGLFAIDDTKDSDATNKGEEPEVKPDPVQDGTLLEAQQVGISLEKLAIYLKKTIGQLTNNEILTAIAQKKTAMKKKELEVKNG
jgi:hypothetical protein